MKVTTDNYICTIKKMKEEFYNQRRWLFDESSSYLIQRDGPYLREESKPTQMETVDGSHLGNNE